MAGSATSGFAAWQKALHAQERQVKQGAKKAVQQALDINQSVSQVLTPIGKRTYKRGSEIHPGYLKSRNRQRWVKRGPDVYTGEYYNDAPYAVYVALGTYKMKARDFVTPGYLKGSQAFEAMMRTIL